MLQGDCTTEPPEGVKLQRGPERMTPRQCVVTVWEDWLEYNAPRSFIWVSDLYVQVRSVFYYNSSAICHATTAKKAEQ